MIDKPPVKFMEILGNYGVSGIWFQTAVMGSYLKRFPGIDLNGLARYLNYVFFTNHVVFNGEILSEATISDVVGYIKEKSVLGSVLMDSTTK